MYLYLYICIYIYVCIYLNHSAIHVKLTEHCRATTLKFF